MIPNLKPLVISAPFGLYCRRPYATSTIGTYTLESRGGTLYRLWRCLLTLRPRLGMGGWTNRLGLPNPGIMSLPPGDYSDRIISVRGFGRDDWRKVAYNAFRLRPAAVELNLSCPNVDSRIFLADVLDVANYLLRSGCALIAKLPPVRPFPIADALFSVGVRAFHCCNTLPTPAGGLSGKPLKELSLWAVSDLRRWWGRRDVLIVGGGGVTTAADVRDYVSAGADCVAVGSGLFNPLMWRRLPALADAVQAARREFCG